MVVWEILRTKGKSCIIIILLVVLSCNVFAGQNLKMTIVLSSGQTEIERDSTIEFDITVVNEDVCSIAVDLNQLGRYITVEAVLDQCTDNLENLRVSDSMQILGDRFCDEETWYVLKPGEKFKKAASIRMGDRDFFKPGSRYSIEILYTQNTKTKVKGVKAYRGKIQSNKIFFVVKSNSGQLPKN